jgi:hypothetical protein
MSPGHRVPPEQAGNQLPRCPRSRDNGLRGRLTTHSPSPGTMAGPPLT